MSTEENAGIWPTWVARRSYDATMLTHYAQEIARRYPVDIWPSAGKPSAENQAAFVAGIRFACDQIEAIAAEISSDVDTIEHEAGLG